MRYFYYVHTGHRIGGDRFRRAVAVIKELQKFCDITLLCSDFRVASYAKELGVIKSAGIDMVRNIPQIAVHGDKIIFDSDEHNPTMHADMVNFFSTFIRFSDNINDDRLSNEYLISPYLEGENILNASIVDDFYFGEFDKDIKIGLFFGDDDYEKDLLTHKEVFKDLDIELLMGFYYFLGLESELTDSFSKIHDSEDYSEFIASCDILITSSPNAVLESLASGSKPIYIQRADYSRDYLEFFRSLNIPVLESFEKDKLITIINSVESKNYKQIVNNNKKVIDFIRKALNL